MQAYHLDKFDSIDGIVRRDSPTPRPDAGEVLVRVRARSLNYRDLLILNKRYPVPAKPGVVPFSDGAGEVVEVGEGVSRVAVGDRVAGIYFPRWIDGRMSLDMAFEQFGCTRDGMLAEFVVANGQALVKIPSHLSFEEAATLPCAGVMAWSSLTSMRPLLPGEMVLTIGTGGVALFALQFAKLFGARVIAITSTDEKAKRLKQLGVDDVVNYKAVPDWERAVRELTGGRGVDHVVETGAIDTLPRSLAAAASEGQIALVAALGIGTLNADALRALVTICRLYVGSRAGFEAMNGAITQSRLRPIIDRVFRLNDAKAAYAHFEARQHVGKVVIADA